MLGLTTVVKCNKITYKPIIVKNTNTSLQFLIEYAQYLFDYVNLCGIDLIYALFILLLSSALSALGLGRSIRLKSESVLVTAVRTRPSRNLFNSVKSLYTVES